MNYFNKNSSKGFKCYYPGASTTTTTVSFSQKGGYNSVTRHHDNIGFCQKGADGITRRYDNNGN